MKNFITTGPDHAVLAFKVPIIIAADACLMKRILLFSFFYVFFISKGNF